MKTKLNLLAAGVFLAALGTGFGQPVITTQPQSQTNVVGTTATFMVVATGNEPLAYQWQKFVSANWSDLAARTNANLSLTNVQTSDDADYRVVITNLDGPVSSDVAHLYVLTPPRITYTISLQHQAVDIGSNASFTVTASGTAPLSYQWRLDDHELSGQTNRMLTFSGAQPADEGDYTVVVSNLAGVATTEPARLWVVPPASAFIKRNFTNAVGLRLPYFYSLPPNYDPARSYPLVCQCHGTPGDETSMTNANYGYAGYLNYPMFKALSSYGRQVADQAIVVWPTRRAGDSAWTDQYLQLVSGMLDSLISEFRIDTNRVYVSGASEGVHAAWDLIGMRPGFFAGTTVNAGGKGVTLPSSIAAVPLWACCAQNDDAGQLPNTRSLVSALRLVRGNPIYTEYTSGGHVNGIGMAMMTPAVLDWLLSQRRGVVSTNEPLLAITSPTSQPVLATGGTALNLAGSAAALGRDVTQITWMNLANNANSVASGTNSWSVANIPLVANKTNLIIVTGTTVSWAPAFGGNTTFSDTLTVIQSPIQATLTLQGTDLILNWTGGAPPYRVQRATDLAVGDWTDYLTDAVPPVSMPLDGGARFYRIVGQ